MQCSRHTRHYAKSRMRRNYAVVCDVRNSGDGGFGHRFTETVPKPPRNHNVRMHSGGVFTEFNWQLCAHEMTPTNAGQCAVPENVRTHKAKPHKCHTASHSHRPTRKAAADVSRMPARLQGASSNDVCKLRNVRVA